MLSIRTFTFLCIVTLFVAAAAVLVSEHSDAIPGSGNPLFPGLMSQLNEIETVQVEGGAERFTIQRSQSGWVVAEKFGHPADGDKVHKLLVGAAGLVRVEPKTSNPALYSKLGLADSSDEGSTATAYRFDSGAGSTVASLTVGNSAPAKGDPDLSEFYVRVPEDPRAWLVEGKLPTDKALIDWLEREVADIDRARVLEVSVEHGSGEVVTVSRNAPADDEFRLLDAPASKTVDGQWKLNHIGRLFSNLQFDDVRPRAEAPLEPDPVYIVTMRTYDGLEIRMQVFKEEKRTQAILAAGFRAESVGPTGGQTAPRSADEVRAEIQALNARWDNWVYVLPSYKVDAMARTQSELLKDPTEKNKPGQG